MFKYEMIIKSYLGLYEITNKIDLCEMKYPNCNEFACKGGKECWVPKTRGIS